MFRLPEFKDAELVKTMERGEFLASHTYSGWNNKRIMEKYFVPLETQHSV